MVGTLLAGPRAADALETDQITVPPQRLADIGPELADEVLVRIDAAVARVNARAVSHARRADAAHGFWRRHHLRERDRNLAEGVLAREVYRELAGAALPECRIERWVRTHPFRGSGGDRGSARFEMSCGAGVYGASPLGRSPLLMSLSPTVNAFGVHFGADKVGHLFQQGYQYYERFAREEVRATRAGGDASAAALTGAVRRGVDQERGFYGAALVGVYSNADLAANYAGLKLYLNLTRAVRVGSAVRPPLFVLRDGAWVRDGAARSRPGEWGVQMPRAGTAGVAGDTTGAVAFLRPFVSDHFNESLNPSRYNQPTRATVRARWRQRSSAWVAFYGDSRQVEADRLARLATWHGEPYGHSGFDGLVTALDTCFNGAGDVTPAARPRLARPALLRADGADEPADEPVSGPLR